MKFHVFILLQKELYMKKVTGIILAVLMAGVMLSGCCCKESCEKPAVHKCYKGENM
jgi:hypothetical protein